MQRNKLFCIISIFEDNSFPPTTVRERSTDVKEDIVEMSEVRRSNTLPSFRPAASSAQTSMLDNRNGNSFKPINQPTIIGSATGPTTCNVSRVGTGSGFQSEPDVVVEQAISHKPREPNKVNIMAIDDVPPAVDQHQQQQLHQQQQQQQLLQQEQQQYLLQQQQLLWQRQQREEHQPQQKQLLEQKQRQQQEQQPQQQQQQPLQLQQQLLESQRHQEQVQPQLRQQTLLYEDSPVISQNLNSTHIVQLPLSQRQPISILAFQPQDQLPISSNQLKPVATQYQLKQGQQQQQPIESSVLYRDWQSSNGKTGGHDVIVVENPNFVAETLPWDNHSQRMVDETMMPGFTSGNSQNSATRGEVYIEAQQPGMQLIGSGCGAANQSHHPVKSTDSSCVQHTTYEVAMNKSKTNRSPVFDEENYTLEQAISHRGATPAADTRSHGLDGDSGQWLAGGTSSSDFGASRRDDMFIDTG